MNEHDAKQRLESWLAEPIPPLDERTLYQTIDRIPSVPQRRRWWPFRWFPLGIGATRSARPSEPDPEPTRSGRFTGTRSSVGATLAPDGSLARRSPSMFNATRVAAAVAIVALGGSLALVSIWPQPEGSGIAPAAVTDEPEAVPDGVHVSGFVGFKFMSDPAPNPGVTTTEPDGSERYRDAWFETVWRSDDPRFTGSGEYTANSNTYPTALEDPVTVGWGTQTLTTEEGTWTAHPAFGLIHGDESIIPLMFEGGGAYEGMSAMIVQQVETLDNGHYRFQFEGWIVPGDAHFEDATR